MPRSDERRDGIAALRRRELTDRARGCDSADLELELRFDRVAVGAEDGSS